MEKLKLVTVYSLALLYIAVGVKHFMDLDFFLAIMPDYLPWHKELVLISGALEILLGTLLVFRATRKYAAYGLIALLLAVFPANIYLAMSDLAQQALGATRQDTLIRLPFQIPLILLAYWHSQEKTKQWFNLLCLILFVPTFIYFLTL
jgi:uncharacterized membrane protein